MRKLLLILAFLPAAAFAQTTCVVQAGSYPVYPVGSTNVPLSLDTNGRVILSTGSGVASIQSKKSPARQIAKAPEPKKAVGTLYILIAFLFP